LSGEYLKTFSDSAQQLAKEIIRGAAGFWYEESALLAVCRDKKSAHIQQR
jgi:hypothetical protein